MRLAKQLKAQGNTLKFASKIPIKPNFTNNHKEFLDTTSNNDANSKSLGGIKNKDKSQPLVSKLGVTRLSLSHESANSCKKTQNNTNKFKTSTTTTINKAENHLNNEKYQVKINSFNHDDDDSLNSNPIR
ncbi:unnamed protein product, partial [Rotaria magnacalcarata]